MSSVWANSIYSILGYPSKVKIALVTPYLPYPPDTGGKIRTFYLLNGIAKNHSVDLFTVYFGAPPDLGEALPGICRNIHLSELRKEPTKLSPLAQCFVGPLPRLVEYFHAPNAITEVRQRLLDGLYDLVVLDEICMTPYVMGVPGRKLVNRHKIDHLHYEEIVSTQPLGMDKLVSWLEVRKLRNYERRAMAEFSTAVCCSDDDAANLHKLNPGIPVSVIGNGVDLDRFTPLEEAGCQPTLLYAGTMHYHPNIDAVHYFFREIHPHLVKLIPEVRVSIVGHRPPEDVLSWQRLPGVKITGSVPDIRPYLAECTATIVPLRLGGGTRLKIMESIASGRPVVSTSVGAQGLGMRHGEHLLLADDPIKFAEEAAGLLNDRELRRHLVAKARPFVVERFSWKALGEKFEILCSELVGRKTP